MAAYRTIISCVAVTTDLAMCFGCDFDNLRPDVFVMIDGLFFGCCMARWVAFRMLCARWFVFYILYGRWVAFTSWAVLFKHYNKALGAPLIRQL